MKARVVGVLLAGMSFLCLATGARAESVAISGRVTLVGTRLTLQVGARVSGSAVSLSGQGFDSPFSTKPASTPPGYCRFPLAGSRAGTVVTISGKVAFSNNATLVGTPVKITADASTGSIIFNFGPFTLTGTGAVVIAP